MTRRILLTTDVVGGVWDFCLALCDALRPNARVTLLALGRPSPAQCVAAASAGVELVSEPLKLEWMQQSEFDVLRTRQLVADLVRDIRPDVLHANQFAAACADVDVPVVLTVHSDVLSWRRWTLGCSEVPPEWRNYQVLVDQALTRSDVVVTVSHFLKHALATHYDVARPIDVIHNGWPASAVEPPGARQHLTLLAGRIWDPAKNIGLAAEAMQGWQPGPVALAGEQVHPDSGSQATVPA